MGTKEAAGPGAINTQAGLNTPNLLRRNGMSADYGSKRVVVWVQHFADRPYLMLQWHDPETGQRRSKSAETADEAEAERKRTDLEYELNHGTYREASKLSWESFRDLFEREYVAGQRVKSRK